MTSIAKKRYATYIILGSMVLLTVLNTYSVYMKKTNLQDNNVTLTTSFSEAQLSIKEIVDMSPVIARVRIDKLKEKTIKTLESTPHPDSLASKNNEKIKIAMPLRFYEAEVKEIIKGEIMNKKINIIVPDLYISSSMDNTNFIIGTEYVFSNTK
jgi:hypothetical protein